MLSPNGPFVLINPSRKLCSGESQTLALSFSPRESILVSAAPRQYATPRPPYCRTVQPPGSTAAPRPPHCRTVVQPPKAVLPPRDPPTLKDGDVVRYHCVLRPR